jgi:long-chain acyl-CoA synthetase
MVVDTFPKLLRENFEKYGNDRVAMRVKDRGIWIRHTWEDYYYKVRYFSLGLIKLGLKWGDKVSILGENKPEWFWAELAAQAAGARVVGIFTDCIPSEVRYYIEHSDSTFVVAQDQEQVDKILQIKVDLPFLSKVIYWDPKGLWSYKDPMLIFYQEVLNLGKDHDQKYPDLFDSNIDKGCGDDIAVICYTSGTTGLPKGAMLSHKFLVSIATEWGKIDKWGGDNREYFSFIPPAWSTEQAMGIAGSLVADMVVNFPEEPETVQDDLREIGPHVLFYGARLWESVNRMVQTKILDASFLKRLTYRIFMPVGYKLAEIEEKSSNKSSILWRMLWFISYWVLFRPLRDQLGLKNAKVVYSAGAAVSPDIIRFFKALGLEIQLYYGCTEIGLVSMPRKGEIRPETSGRILPWVEVKLSKEGEILVKTRYSFPGYYKDPEATQKKFKDGWYCTGDFGYMDDNHLIVIDRMDDLKELASGYKFSPQFIEIRLRFSPYIKDCLVIGEKDKEFISVLVNIDLDSVGKWAEKNGVTYTTFTDLSQKSEVIELIKREIIKINRLLPESSRIKKFINMYKEFDPDEAEMTRTRKLRRSYVEERFSDLIAASYGDRNELNISVPITYQDGRKGTLESTVHINTI